jgi:ATP-binding cassette subfamily F protein 3
VGHRVQAAYFTQHGAGLRDDRTVVETVLAASDLTPTQARTLLGGFLFPGEAAETPVERLSGGERRRLELVALIARGGNLLVLDEPTNHLDTESREALESALEAFDGTVLLVSHDRALIDAVATHTLAIEDGRAVLRAGGYGDLLRARQEAEAAPAPQPATAPRRPRRRRRMSGAAPPRSPNGEVRRLEGEIARVEAGIAEVEAALADPAVLADREAVAARGEAHRALQEELSWLMREWERAAEAAAR